MQRLPRVLADVDADFIHHRDAIPVDLYLADADGVHIDAVPV